MAFPAVVPEMAPLVVDRILGAQLTAVFRVVAFETVLAAATQPAQVRAVEHPSPRRALRMVPVDCLVAYQEPPRELVVLRQVESRATHPVPQRVVFPAVSRARPLEPVAA